MLEAYVKNSNLVALKTLTYIAKSDKIDVEKIHTLEDSELVFAKISTKDLMDYCEVSKQTLDRNIKKMTETSIKVQYDKKHTYIDKKHTYINLLPWAEFNYDGFIEVRIFAGILKLTHALESYAMFDVKTMASLKKAHSIRMLMLLERINNFGTNVAKRKRYNLEELNEMFDTKYKTIPEFIRAVLKPAKAELDEKSKLTFLFEQRKDKEERTVGRAKVVEVVIDLIEKKEVVKEDKQGTLKGTDFDKKLEQYIGKRFYKDGYDWKIKSISTNGKLYSAYCYDIDRPSDTKHFEFSIEQLKQFKD